MLTNFDSPSRSLNLRPNSFDFWMIYQTRPENEFWYGDCGYITGAKIVRMYINPLIPMRIVVLSPTAVLMFITKSPSPMKNRKRET